MVEESNETTYKEIGSFLYCENNNEDQIIFANIP